MKIRTVAPLIFVFTFIIAFSCSQKQRDVVIITSKNASSQETLAAKEIRRYVYQRTGQLLPIKSDNLSSVESDVILLARKDSPLFQELKNDDIQKSMTELKGQQYLLKTIKLDDKKVVIICGGDDIGTLYAAYRFAEHLGVRFYLHGDVIHDEKISLWLPKLDETAKPLFNLRGIQPFHDFPEGPDWWSIDDYKAVLAQLPKLRMNFFGLHTYPEGGVGPEPTVWIGLSQNIKQKGDVKFSYPARHFTTFSGTWGYQARNTIDYYYGAGEMFDRDDYGADYMRDMTPWPNTTEDCNRIFNRVGNALNEAFSYAKELGIKTCVGTETPLIIPNKVKERLQGLGKDPKDPQIVQELYQGIFEWVKKNYPIDYYWFWTPEDWTWQDTKEEDIQATKMDFQAAIAAARQANVPFTLATCGWVLGPKQDRAMFDRFLPKEMPMSCINRSVGFSPVEPGFAAVTGRPLWAIPWMEDDPAMIIPQLWVGRMRRDAADALAYGCTGLMGIHWRTRILGPNVSALAHAAWDQKGWNKNLGKKATVEEANKAYVNPIRDLTANDFYYDWALSQFGEKVAKPIAKIFTKLDGGELKEVGITRKANLPRPADWDKGPGGIQPDTTFWEQARLNYSFIEEMEHLRPKIKGDGNLERFDYWLNNFYYLRAVGKFSCTLAEFNTAMEKVKAEKNPAIQKQQATDILLPLRKKQIAELAEIHKYLLATINTTGAMGNVVNWQQHNIPRYIEKPGQELADILGQDLPDDALPSTDYVGPVRMFVPTVRSSLISGESLKLNVILMGAKPQEAVLYWKALGEEKFAKKTFEHVNRGVYSIMLSPKAIDSDFEYYIQIITEKGEKLLFPATAPVLNQSVVVNVPGTYEVPGT